MVQGDPANGTAFGLDTIEQFKVVWDQLGHPANEDEQRGEMVDRFTAATRTTEKTGVHRAMAGGELVLDVWKPEDENPVFIVEVDDIELVRSAAHQVILDNGQDWARALRNRATGRTKAAKQILQAANSSQLHSLIAAHRS